MNKILIGPKFKKNDLVLIKETNELAEVLDVHHYAMMPAAHVTIVNKHFFLYTLRLEKSNVVGKFIEDKLELKNNLKSFK